MSVFVEPICGGNLKISERFYARNYLWNVIDVVSMVMNVLKLRRLSYLSY